MSHGLAPRRGDRAARLRDFADVARALPLEIAPRRQYEHTADLSASNEVAELAVDGRPLIVKRSRRADGVARFRASRLAAALLRRRTGVIAPEHVALPEEVGEHAVEAYWRVPYSTLGELWPALPERARAAALRSWGALLRRVHKVKLGGYGPLAEAASGASSLEDFLRADLGERLAPAMAAAWPSAAPTVRRASALVPWIVRHVSAPAVLVHQDLHMGNVLCAQAGRSVRCVGVLDLEHAVGGPPESDVARVEVLHGPHFGAPLEGRWLSAFLEGYRAPLEPRVVAFFRVYHLLNLGYHAATAGWSEHAGAVLREAEERLMALAGSDEWSD